MKYCTVDGKVLLIGRVEETEYFKAKRIQVSYLIYVPRINVTCTRYPRKWTLLSSVPNTYAGKYLVAWHPNPSEETKNTVFPIIPPKLGNTYTANRRSMAPSYC